MKKRTIRVPFKSWMYLDNLGCSQRTGHEHSQKFIERIKREFDARWKEKGKEVIDKEMGGAIGEPENSYEDGRWTTWSIEEMKGMLDEAGLPYVDGEEVECINVYF